MAHSGIVLNIFERQQSPETSQDLG